MRKIIYLSLILIFVFLFKTFPIVWAQDAPPVTTPPVGAQPDPGAGPAQPGTPITVKSNAVCTKVGNPGTDKPEICTLPPLTTPSVGAASCPLQGTRVIGCGSFMSDPKYNRGACAGPDPINRGHCGTTYGCYKGSIAATLNSRRSHSIDVDAQPGEIVYLPTINGQSLTWTYQPGMSYSVDPGAGGGYGHVLTADSGEGRWVLHLLHMNTAVMSAKSNANTYASGDPITTVAATGYPHLHINIGLNPSEPNGGSGWLDPESLGMCIN